MSKNKLIDKNQNQNKLMNLSKIIGSLALVMGFFLMTALPVVASEKAI